MNSTNHVRQTFLNFFAGKDHLLLPSSSLVPHQDPTLMFSNAGMNQFKHVFTGNEQPKAARATTSQKCVRAGGKHNDLDNVGYTARHHTFFEMLGNFSFGDYFKEDAIAHAWELLTEVFNIPADKLYVTVYHTDDEAFDIWKETTGFPDEKILRIPTKDNFWQMGDTGPCGPCSEIFYDHGADAADGDWALNEDGSDRFGDRYIEIWNLVFMQFDRQADGTDLPLPAPSIDTGMGLERIAAVLQGKHNNYDIDIFKNIISASEKLTNTKAEGEQQASHRVIADHLRASCFLMADGVLPSNEGRGYVLRRIMRRAMRHAHILGAKEPLMHRLVSVLIAEMGEAYPELGRAKALITENLRLEEERFRETLGRGLKLLEEETSKLSKGDKLEGTAAFKLYDTYGFPLDLTQDIMRGKGMSVDIEGFNAAMAEQKSRARAAWKGSGDARTQQIWLELRDKHGATEFLGYDNEISAGQLIAIVKDGTVVEAAKSGDKVQLIFNQTPFYGESGGQQGDYGQALNKDAVIAEISDTLKPADGLHVHHAKLSSDIAVGDELELQVNAARRAKLRANHSATHLLNAALRKVLGDHISQKGSDVAEDKLRFDISHPKSLSADEISQVEALVNEQIWHNSEVTTKLMATDDAVKAGATAMFGEKYGDEVRVVAMGASIGAVNNIGEDSSLSEPSASEAARHRSAVGAHGAQNKSFSTELCGGIHVERTGDIGLLKITSEGALASGVRRIEAVTRDAAFAWLNDRNKMLVDMSAASKTPIAELPQKMQSLADERKRLDKELGDAKRKLALGSGGEGGASFEKVEIGDISFVSQSFNGVNPKDLRSLATEIMQKSKGDVVAVGSNFEGKAAIIVTAAKESGVDSAKLVQIATPIVGGQGGGGRPEMAQGGGSDGSKIKEALQAIASELENK